MSSSQAVASRLPRPPWLASPKVFRTEVLAGLVVALALIPEAISFSILAGVDPQVGLFASFTMAVVIAFCGGRPAMISAATGAIALVVAPLAKEHGLGFLVAAVILGGLIQIVLALLGVAKLMRFIPRSVMVGFVNALAILVFMAQLPHLIGVPWLVYPMVAVALAIIVGLPRLTAAVPAPLVAIVVLTAVTVAAGLAVPTVGDEGALPDSLPMFGLPDVPYTLDTLKLIAPYALGDRPGRADGVADDGEARRRHHRHSLEQDPRVVGAGRGEHRHRLLRRHGRLRDDRPDDDQREGRPVPGPGSRPSPPASSCCSWWWRSATSSP